jgi:hypothetical protein
LDRSQLQTDFHGSKSIQSRENFPSVSFSVSNRYEKRGSRSNERSENKDRIDSIPEEDGKITENKQIIQSKFNQKTSNSNVNLPKINLEEDYHKVPAVHINFTERASNEKEKLKTKTGPIKKNHTFFKNISTNTKENLFTNSLILSDPYNSQGNSHVVPTMRSIELKPSTFSNVKYMPSKRQDEILNNKSTKYSMEKLDSDFQFKNSHLNFNPLKGLAHKLVKTGYIK